MKCQNKLSLFFTIIAVHMGIFLCAQRSDLELLFSYEIESQIASGKLSGSSASYRYTFISDYHAAISAYDIPVSWGVDTMRIPKNIQLIDAQTAILKEAADHQIVIISESHLKPQHRIFAKKLIVSLTELGFQYIGLEALAPSSNPQVYLLDSLLPERGYPIYSPSAGFYTQEPQMANLLRVSLDLGYVPFAYESAEKIKGKDRDEIQADNIVKILNEIPDAKIIILCGWHHAIESDLIKRGHSHWMAKYIKEKTGIDPLTIYQDNFTEKVVTNEHPVLSRINILSPSVFTDQHGQILRLTNNVDIEVIHPKTRYIYGRPDWLVQDETYVYHFVDDDDLLDLTYPLMIKAYLPGESDKAVPVDIIEHKHKYDRKPLILKKGKYRLVIVNKSQAKQLDITVQ